MKYFQRFYLIVGTLVCLWLTVAAFAGWKAPNMGFLDGSAGRSSGGFWGGGK